MAKYMTAQRKILLDFFSNNPDKQFSAKQIAEEICKTSISISAIYRNLSYLSEAGLVTRTIKATGEECFYQYTHHDFCKNAIHLTCTQCGEIFHMDDSITSQMLAALVEKQGFTLNKSQTSLFGVCKQCTILQA